MRLAAAGASVALVGGGIGIIASAAPGQAAVTAAAHDHHEHNGCHLGNGVKHVVQISFDNVHFFRDNPNVPSDLQLMPNLLNFIQNNGTLLSNNHTPLIAHTADDLLTTATGLYGDRQGQPVSNSYQAYNADGTTDSAGSFTYWTDPIYDTASTPNAGHDTNPNMVYSPVPPSTASSPVSPTDCHPGALGSLYQGWLQRRRGRDREPGTGERELRHSRRCSVRTRPRHSNWPPMPVLPRITTTRWLTTSA